MYDLQTINSCLQSTKYIFLQEIQIKLTCKVQFKGQLTNFALFVCLSMLIIIDTCNSYGRAEKLKMIFLAEQLYFVFLNSQTLNTW